MGLFESKKIKEEKELYQKLIELKDSSYQLKMFLPATVKEFLNFRDKDRLISIYKYTLEIIKRNDITQAFKIKNMGGCYDFVSDRYNSYIVKQDMAKSRNQPIESDFMTFLEVSIAPELILYKNKQEEIKIELENKRMRNELRGRMKQLQNAPGSIRSSEVAAEEAKKLNIIMKQSDFEKKFPQYMEVRHAVGLCKMGIGIDKPLVIAIKNWINHSKENLGIPNLEFDDFLVPYLEEKHKYGILEKEEAKIYFRNTNDSLEIEIKKRAFCLYNIACFFCDTDKEQNDFMNTFEETINILTDFSRNVKGSKR